MSFNWWSKQLIKLQHLVKTPFYCKNNCLNYWSSLKWQKTTFQVAHQSLEFNLPSSLRMLLIVFWNSQDIQFFYEEDIKIDKSTFINYSRAEVFDSDKHNILFYGLKLSDYFFTFTVDQHFEFKLSSILMTPFIFVSNRFWRNSEVAQVLK